MPKLDPRFHTLRLILGDQLNAQHPWFRQRDPGVLYVLAELHQEMHYVTHHVQKICAFFAAMQAFAEALRSSGHAVSLLTLDDSAEDADLAALIQRLCVQHQVSHFEYQRPDEYRLLIQLRGLTLSNIESREADSAHFLLPFDEIPQYFKRGRHNKMEYFYRKLRRRFAVLMEGDVPEGGRWNFDSDNRQALKADDLDAIPPPMLFHNDVSRILARLRKHNIATLGQTGETLHWPITRRQSLALLRDFIARCLPCFGRFQDAMTTESPHAWSLYHSRLSFALNSKMLSPRQVIDAAINAYHRQPEHYTIASVEGFVRQILGWREYVRGVYWSNMPQFKTRNALQAKHPLPDYFWHGRTRMRCMAHALRQSLEHAYAHHIQRLMITGNFCLLSGIHPDAVDNWYLGIYIDAIEWVEMPNTRGMSQFADGGITATKPYAAGGNYINRMSDYCRDCHYDVKQKVGERACPFNSLYWHFMQQHRTLLANNPRVAMLYKQWDSQPPSQREAVLERARWCIDHVQLL